MQFSCATVLFPELTDLAEIASRVRAAGYDAIDWRVQTDYHVAPETLAEDAAAIREVCEAEGLDLGTLRSYVAPGDVELFKVVAHGAAEMGCPRVRIGGFPYDGSECFVAIYERAFAQLDAIERAASEAGVRALIEVHFGTIHCSPSGTLALVRGRSPSALGVIVDPSNMVIEGREEWRMSFEMLWDYLAVVDVRNTSWVRSDENGRAWRWEWAPLDAGIADWPQIVRLLAELGFDGYLTNENILQVPTSSTGYIGERHDSLGGYEGHRSIEQRLADLDYLRSLVPAA